MPTGKDMMALPKTEIVSMAMRAKNSLKKNAAMAAERTQSLTHLASSLGGAAIMGTWNGNSRKSARENGEDETEALQWAGVDRDVFMAAGALAIGMLGPQRGKGALFSHTMTGVGTGIGAYYLGSMLEDKMLEDDDEDLVAG